MISAQPQAIWDVLADFGAIGAWADGVDHSCLLYTQPQVLGTTRRVQVGRNALVERITEFDPPTALTYDVEGLPRWIGALASRWTLRPSGDRTEVTLTSIVDKGSGPVAELAARILARVVATLAGSMLTGLARLTEERSD